MGGLRRANILVLALGLAVGARARAQNLPSLTQLIPSELLNPPPPAPPPAAARPAPAPAAARPPPARVIPVIAQAPPPLYPSAPPAPPPPPPYAPPAAPPSSPSPAQAPPPTVLLPPEPTESAQGAAPSDAEPVKPAPAAPRARRSAAIIQALDKITAETLRFEAQIEQPVRYKDLVITVHACQDGGTQGQRGAAANLQIESQPRPVAGRQTPPTRELFHGWMFASAPGVHPFEHPVYDAWLIACKADSPPA